MAVDKLVDSTQLNADLTSVANAIRAKGGTSASLAFPAGFVDAIGDIETGGGGASNVVTGTFTGTTTGAAMDISVPYTGNGYPVAVAVFPTEGYANSSTGSFNRTVQRYVASMVFLVKAAIDHAPNYTGTGDNYSGQHRYKSSATNASMQTVSSINTSEVCSDTDAISDTARLLKIRSKNKLSVYIASSSYGFMANIEYTYHVIYSE